MSAMRKRLALAVLLADWIWKIKGYGHVSLVYGLREGVAAWLYIHAMADTGVGQLLDIDVLLLRPLFTDLEDVEQLLEATDVDWHAEIVEDRHVCLSDAAKAEGSMR